MNDQNKLSIRDAVRANVVNLLTPKPKDENEVVKPSNAGLKHALLDFNLMFFILDLTSAGIVGWLTYWFYGAMALVAGIYPMLGWEHKFTRGHNSIYQKWISGIGIGIGALSTITIAILSAIVSVMKLNSIFGINAFELGMAIVLVSIVFTHGIMNGLYYFIDDGIAAIQKLAHELAGQEKQIRDIRFAGILGKEASKAVDLAVSELEQDHGIFVDAAYQSMTGNSLMHTPATNNENKQSATNKGFGGNDNKIRVGTGFSGNGKGMLEDEYPDPSHR